MGCDNSDLEPYSKTHKDPPRTYHASFKLMCKFRLVVPGLPADNLQQSDECSHIGPSGNCKCCRCYVGGSVALCELNDGYYGLHEVGFWSRLTNWSSNLWHSLDDPAQTIQPFRKYESSLTKPPRAC